MSTVRFTEVFEDVTKQAKKIPTSEYCDEGKYIIVDQGQNYIAGYTNEEQGVFEDVPAIIFGDHTRVIKYVDTPCFLGADGVKLLKAKVANPDYKYLYYALLSVDIPNTGYNRHFKWLKEAKIAEYPPEKQQQIVFELDKVTDLIDKHNLQLKKLDELVKARFVEMFGDPSQNNKNMAIKSMTELCSIIDGDRGKNYPKQEEFSETGYCLFLNAKNVTANGFCFNKCMFITKEKDDLLKNGRISRGDIILTTRGTVGNLAFYDDAIPFENIRINSGMVILRLEKDCICEKFFIEQFKFQLQTIKEKVLSGSAQPQLPISTMNQIKLIIPPIELQNQFAILVEQVEKQKAQIQKSLEKLETLKKSLMQKYFG